MKTYLYQGVANSNIFDDQGFIDYANRRLDCNDIDNVNDAILRLEEETY